MDLILEQLTSCLSLCVWWWELGRSANLHVFCGLGESLKPCSLVNPLGGGGWGRGGSTWAWDMEALPILLIQSQTSFQQMILPRFPFVYDPIWRSCDEESFVLRTWELCICWQMLCFVVGFIMHSGITFSKHWSSLIHNLKWPCGQSYHSSSILSYKLEPLPLCERQHKTPAHQSADRKIEKTTRTHSDFQAI